MNIVQSSQDYINKMLSNIPGMKVIVLDRETAGILSMVCSKSQILQREVFLFERIDVGTREMMPHLKAVCLLRPTLENIMLLQKELREPKYGEYNIFFTNIVKNSHLEDLAQSDEHEVVAQVQEYFCDYYAVNPDLFNLNIDSVISLEPSFHQAVTERICDGLTAVLLSLKKNPVIRYQKNSEMCQRISRELTRRITGSQDKSLFEFRKSETSPVLLVIDRCNDPVTPLLAQWTYQAMIHELLTIKNNRVDLRGVSGIKKELEEVVLSMDQDPFFSKNIYSNYGDLAINIKSLLDELQKHAKTNTSIQSISDMKKFIENYPEYRKLSGNVSKHVAILDEMHRVIEKRDLMNVSELEQEIACKDDQATHHKSLVEIFSNSKVTKDDKLKMLMIYSLRYELVSNKMTELAELLISSGVPRDTVALVSAMKRYGGEAQRTGDLFANKDFIASFSASVQRGIQGAQNVFTQHKPFLIKILNDMLKGYMKETEFPALNAQPQQLKERPQDIIVFIAGGATYEEALHIAQFNQTTPNVRVVLGGTTVHSSTSFLGELTKLRNIASNYSSAY
eukprot:TRINITY_DN8349_c0_g1_i1.p1 TRINITY_DN8349_c0_g1~~TRINITY_DN8349_c0_g1_i1.p1  ORF type:complete len:576 (-),score=250.29 TRINITY_DN8349_c0_g1_i1:33-1727(-)